MFSHLQVVLVLDGARWPLKSSTHTVRRNKRDSTLEKAVAADNMNDPDTADRYYKQAVHIPAEFISWIIKQGNATANVSVVVANYEADAQLHQLQRAGKIDRVLSAAEDSDFLVYGMDNVMYNLRADGAFHHISVHTQVIGQRIGDYDFSAWQFYHFRVWSCGCGCDYVDNILHIGGKKLYKHVHNNLHLGERELCRLVADKSPTPDAYFNDLLAAVLSFQHHVVFEEYRDGDRTLVALPRW